MMPTFTSSSGVWESQAPSGHLPRSSGRPTTPSESTQGGNSMRSTRAGIAFWRSACLSAMRGELSMTSNRSVSSMDELEIQFDVVVTLPAYSTPEGRGSLPQAGITRAEITEVVRATEPGSERTRSVMHASCRGSKIVRSIEFVVRLSVGGGTGLVRKRLISANRTHGAGNIVVDLSAGEATGRDATGLGGGTSGCRWRPQKALGREDLAETTRMRPNGQHGSSVEPNRSLGAS